MSYTSTLTASSTDAYTEARARYVMGKAYDDFLALMSRGFANVTKDVLDNWREDLLYFMDKRALDWFQVQFVFPDGTQKALMYEVKPNGMFLADNASGGINFWQFPRETRVSLLVHRNQNSRAETDAYILRKGWGTGSEIKGNSGGQITFSKDNYGLTRKMIG